MKRASFVVALAAALAGGEAKARAQGAEYEPTPYADNAEFNGTLSVSDVLSTAALHFPRILESLADRDAAAGRTLSAAGAFDLVVSSNGRARASGFWSGRFIDNEISQPLAPFGATLFGNYRIADGTFPIYEDIYFTNRAGEFKVGVLLNLLRDREIDARRFGRLDARLAYEIAEFELLLARVGVQHQAMTAYYNWLFAGLQLQVYRDLLAISLERQTRLADQVARGARAAIVLTENQQNVLRRETLVAEAERTAAAAATILSLYLRNEGGAPITPQPAARPSRAPPAEGLAAEAIAQSQYALAARPDLAALRTELARADARIALSRNELKPKLDFSYEIARDLGGIQEGGPSREGLDNIVAFSFKTPLQRRFARGRVLEEQAKRRSLEFRLQRISEQIAAQIENIRIELVATERLVNLAGQEVEQAQAMQTAEVRLFDGGASDFFRVNLREEQTADARIRALQAQLRQRVALADLYAATVNLDALGLAPAAPTP